MDKKNTTISDKLLNLLDLKEDYSVDKLIQKFIRTKDLDDKMNTILAIILVLSDSDKFSKYVNKIIS